MIKVKRFTAEWCSPCRALAPIIEEIKAENPDVTFETIDVDENPDVVSEYGIRGIPVVIVQNDGIETSRFVGIQPKNVYESAINNQRSN
jgi:thioredoxin 1